MTVRVKTFKELGELGVQKILQFGYGAEIVCGPVSTGGKGSVHENIPIFNRSIATLKDEYGRPIFSQIFLEEHIRYLYDDWKKDPKNTGYCMPILEEVYYPIFKTRRLRGAFFIPGWQGSFGTSWEYKTLPQFDVWRAELPPGWTETYTLTPEFLAKLPKV